MHLRRRLLGLALATAATAASLSTMAAGPAQASVPTAPDRGGAVTLTVALRPANPAGLATLAAHAPLGRRARLAALGRVRPTNTSRDRVVGWLRAHGLTIDGNDGWSVTATGSPAAALAASAAITRALPGAAEAVVGLSRRAVWHHAASPTPAYTAQQIRSAYGAPAGSSAGSGVLVASVQYSGWAQLSGTANGGDLVNFANANNLPVPQLTAVSVNGASVTTPDAPGDDFEVAMDTEALTAAAPGAAQRVYVTSNDVSGGLLVWQRIADDVAYGGVPIAVVTTSWGDCEQDLGSAVVNAMETQIERLAALGVTVFGASGDTSAWDCPAGTPWTQQPTVDFPASSPYVVGVGGTSLSQSASGTWTESAWGPRGIVTGPANGSGGGISTMFTRPAWQAQLPGFPNRRLVPDIAAVADPADGFTVYWAEGGGGAWWDGGGTSLGAPLEAGMFAATLASSGHSGGVGDIHVLLYAHPQAFRDVVTGGNGAYLAGTGYDLVTGLGSPQWQQLAPYLSGPSAVAARTGPGTATVALGLPTSVPATGYAVGPAVTGCQSDTAGTPPASVAVSLPPGTTSVAFAVQTAAGCVTTTAPVPASAGPPAAGATLARVGRGELRLTVSGAPADAAFRIELDRDGAPYLTTYAADPQSVDAQVPVGGIWQLRVQAFDAVGNASAWATSAPVDLAVPVVAVTGVHGPAFTWQNGGWADLGQALSAPPAVTGWQGSTYFFGVTTGHQVLVRTGHSGWAPAVPAGSFCWHVAATVVSGTLYLTCETQAHQAWVGWTALSAGTLPRIPAWHDLGGLVIGAPVAGVVNGTLTFFAVGLYAPHHVYWRTLPVKQWYETAQTCQAGPAMADDGTVAYVGCVDPGGRVVVQTHTSSGWLPWQSLGAGFTGVPGLALNAGALTVYAQNAGSGAVATRTLTTGWTSLGGQVAGGVGAGSV